MNLNAYSFNFDEMFGKYHKKVFFTLRKWGAEYEEAEECAQEIFVKILKNYHTYDPTKGSEAAWVFSIARNVCIDLFRKNNKYSALQSIQNLDSSGWLSTDSEEQKRDQKWVQEILVKRIKELPEPEKSIVILRFFKECTAEEVGKTIGVSVRTVSRKTISALTILKMQLKRDGLNEEALKGGLL
ncbi:hypothetical protein CH373_02365 [Leptospira perolatii]|uniref:RNA polymerase subunit sigma-70 n=1 Tax=Leptospira perolatii TaxID=2023191 RepID=A0A2M9ZS53_9LEPT|nr:RNA polymerase sigma factor [Leptospira perolatii]PJZ71362.1 hypothetical protein CH360_02365 [Leptospira perolatii]PJZ74896.1 hypothetical protein CH373_02365 [Leptospira perolatii]